MKARTPRRTALTLALALGASALFTGPERAANAAPAPRDIMDKVTQTRKLAGSEAVVKMSIINEKGQARERKVTVATKLFDGGKTEKRIYRFLSPADVEGTGVLLFDYDAQADDTWVFVPALRKTRRIVSSQRSQSFMGSEFSFGDLNIPALDDFTYALVKEESFGGEDCFVVDVTPKSKEVADAEGYSKKTYWVSKAKFTIRKGHYFDLEKKLLKELLASDIKLLDPKNNRYRPMKMEMINKQNGRRSVFESTEMKFVPDTKDEYFTTRYLERQ